MEKTFVTKIFLPKKEKYLEYINEIWESWWLTNNWKMLQNLEKQLAEYLWVENILIVSNWTIALQVLYKTFWLKWNVITTPFSFVATTSSLAWEWLEPSFVDINKDSFTIDEQWIEDNINNNTSAILWVHVYWNPCNVEELEWIAQKNNIKLIFDAAHCFWVDYKWKSILNYWDASILSFHSTKLFHTIEWWAIIFKNKEDLEKARKIINFWMSWPETIEEIWINWKMNEFEAAMWLCILDDIDENIKLRKKVSEFYEKNLNKKYLKLKWREWTDRNYAYFPILFDSEEELLEKMKDLNNNNVFPRRYFYPSLNTLNYLNYRKMEISESISKRVLCLPLFESLDKEKQKLIITILNK